MFSFLVYCSVNTVANLAVLAYTLVGSGYSSFQKMQKFDLTIATDTIQLIDNRKVGKKYFECTQVIVKLFMGCEKSPKIYFQTTTLGIKVQ